MDTRTSAYSAYCYTAAPDGMETVAVTRWSARLVDPQVEQDYRLDRFAEDRRRVMLLLTLASIASGFNFLVQLYVYSLGGGGLNEVLPPFVTIWLPLVGLAVVQRVRTPNVLEGTMVLFIAVGMITRMTLMTLHPAISFLWPTLIIGIVFVIYIYLPVRFLVAAALATAFTVVASTWWLLIAGTTLPTDQLLRVVVWLLFANALGFIAANSVQRGQRVRYAQSLLLKELLSTDAMTGIGNRRRFDDALDREWRRCSRSGKPLSLLMIDVDHFKAYNDCCGHQQGDACLRLVAQILVHSVGRPGDLVARYGGEEFCCLLPEIGAVGAQAVAEKLSAAVQQADIAHPALGPAGRLTISIGVATAADLALQRPDSLVAMADKLLYEAKGAGRDRLAAGELKPAQALA